MNQGKYKLPKQLSNVDTDREEQIVREFQAEIKHLFSLATTDAIEKLMQDFNDFKVYFPADVFVKEPYDETNETFAIRDFPMGVTKLAAKIYGVTEIECKYWHNPKQREGEPAMYRIKFGPKIGSAVPSLQSYPIT